MATATRKHPRSYSPDFDQPEAKVAKLGWNKKIDGQRYVERILRKASANKIVLPFRLVDFQRAKDSGLVPMSGPKFTPVVCTPSKVPASDGPKIFVDMDDHFILFYCPYFIPQTRANLLCERILELVQSNPPKADKSSGDKRSQGVPMELSSFKSKPTVPTLATLPPSAYYVSPAWYGTAQEHRTEPTTSQDMKTLTSERSLRQLTALQDCMQDIDHQIRHLVDMISPQLGHKLQQLRQKVANQSATCQGCLRDKWTSAFMCQAIAFNRKTQLHRDSKGFCNTLEAIYLLGEFNRGHLRFPDLNLEVEWGSTDFCMFDGYTFSHEATDWTGDGRVCCISFCRASTFKGLGVPLYMPCPKASEIPSTLRRNP